MDRKSFIKSAMAVGAFTVLPGGGLSAKGYAANGKVRLAAIGVGQ